MRSLLVVLAIAAAPSLAAQQAASAPLSSADSAAMALVERSAAAYTSARTLRAEFVQTLTNPRSGSVQTARGEFLQRGTSQFAFAFTEPAGDRIIADGEDLWIYLPSSAPGQALKVPRAAAAGIDLASSILRSPRTRYNVRALDDTTSDGRTVRRVVLTPRGVDAGFRTAELWIAPSDHLIRRAVIAEALGMVRTIDFVRVRVGSEIAAEAFTFVPPAGVRVIDQAAMLGGSTPTKRP